MTSQIVSTPTKARSAAEAMRTPSVMRRSELNTGFGIKDDDDVPPNPKKRLATIIMTATSAKRPTVSNDFQMTSLLKNSHTPSTQTPVRIASASTNANAAMSCIAFMTGIVTLHHSKKPRYPQNLLPLDLFLTVRFQILVRF